MWVANLANGATIEETWIENEFSPWTRLMEYCKQKHTYLTALKICINDKTFSCPANAYGYWQAQSLDMTQGFEQEKASAIGWVQLNTPLVNCIWVKTNPLYSWTEQRAAETQQQIIWSK